MKTILSCEKWSWIFIVPFPLQKYPSHPQALNNHIGHTKQQNNINVMSKIYIYIYIYMTIFHLSFKQFANKREKSDAEHFNLDGAKPSSTGYNESDHIYIYIYPNSCPKSPKLKSYHVDGCYVSVEVLVRTSF